MVGSCYLQIQNFHHRQACTVPTLSGFRIPNRGRNKHSSDLHLNDLSLFNATSSRYSSNFPTLSFYFTHSTLEKSILPAEPRPSPRFFTIKNYLQHLFRQTCVIHFLQLTKSSQYFHIFSAWYFWLFIRSSAYIDVIFDSSQLHLPSSSNMSSQTHPPFIYHPHTPHFRNICLCIGLIIF